MAVFPGRRHVRFRGADAFVVLDHEIKGFLQRLRTGAGAMACHHGENHRCDGNASPAPPSAWSIFLRLSLRGRV